MFSHLVPCYKWRHEYRDVKEGDVVLLKDNNVVCDSYKLAIIKKTMEGVDGHVRRVVVGYKNVDKDTKLEGLKFKETEQSIHNVVVIVPVDWEPEEI